MKRPARLACVTRLARLAQVLALALLLCLGLLCLPGCEPEPKKPEAIRIGVTFGVDATERWPLEQHYMHERAKELGVHLESRITTSSNPAMQYRQCEALLDSGVDAIIVMSRDFPALRDVYDKARKMGVKIVCYTRMPLGHELPDLFVGFDNFLVGRAMGQFLGELVPAGDYIILRGDADDTDARDIELGVRDGLPQLDKEIRVICNDAIAQWSPAEVRKVVRAAVLHNNGKVDAILAPTDQMAEASLQALADIGFTGTVPVTGFMAELEAIHRLREGTQSMTILPDYRQLARVAVEQAVQLAQGKAPRSNVAYDMGNGRKVDALLLPCQVITPQNIESRIIAPGVYTRHQVYGDKR